MIVKINFGDNVSHRPPLFPVSQMILFFVCSTPSNHCTPSASVPEPELLVLTKLPTA